MKGEINEEFYCLSYKTPELGCPVFNNCLDGDGRCDRMRCKFPTPEQFKEYYEEEYPDDGAVYLLNIPEGKGTLPGWRIESYAYAKQYAIKEFNSDPYSIVCACTPFGRPPDNWRPE